MMRQNADVAQVLIVGGGIAGMSVAAFAAPDHDVVVVEAEPTLAYHTTGRSAAVMIDSVEAPPVQRLTRASREYVRTAHEHDELTPQLWHPRGFLCVAFEGGEEHLDHLLDESPGLTRVGEAEARRRFAPLRPGVVQSAAIEDGGWDLDVLGLHQHFLRAARRAGASVLTSAPVTAASFRSGQWVVTAGSHSLTADVVVNAAGAWGDRVASLFGAVPLGLSPRRRTAMVARSSIPVDPSLPFMESAAATFYVRPEGENLMVSLAEETPFEPCDVQPDELDVALAIDRLNEATTFGVRSIVRPWAGLRTFAPDRLPVNGFDPDVPGFYWVVGQGGFGIQTSAAMGMLCAANVGDGSLPPVLAEHGVDPADYVPSRVRPA